MKISFFFSDCSVPHHSTRLCEKKNRKKEKKKERERERERGREGGEREREGGREKERKKNVSKRFRGSSSRMLGREQKRGQE